MGVLAKMLSKDIATMPLVFYRSIFALCILLFYMIITKQVFTFNNKKLLLLRGLLGSTGLVAYFHALHYITASEASMLISTGPIWTNIFSIIFLGEKVGKYNIIALVISLCGILLITSPVFSDFNLGYILALFTGLMAGTVHVLLRKLNQTDSPFSMVLSLTVFCIILSIGSSVSDFISHKGIPDYLTVYTFILLLLVGIVSASGQIHISLAYKYIPASIGSILSLLITVWIILLAIPILNEKPSTQALIGGIFVLTGSAIIIKQRKS